MTVNEAKTNLLALERKMAAYEHAMGLINYDGMTTAPSGTTAHRGESLEVLNEVYYVMSTGDEMSSLIDYLSENTSELDELTKRIVTLRKENLEQLKKIPMDEYLAMQKLLNESESVWHDAKANNDYELLLPYLDKIVDFYKRVAGYVRPDMKPYDYWLDSFEKGLTTEVCDNFFGPLTKALTPLIHAVCEKPKFDIDFMASKVSVDKQRKLSDFLMETIGLDRAHVGIGETEHPFTTGFTKYDVRITTHYHERAFASSMFSVFHEGGHALYEANTDDKYAYTCVGTGVSMAVHESQSRFFENYLARSREFVGFLAPTLRKLNPTLKTRSDDDFYKAFNASTPSLIRTEADELTYCMHIAIRYELEKRLFSGDITAKDLPCEWNRLYKEYLGVDVPSDREGVLQDTHWPSGLFGYFPSYAIGSAYGAQLLKRMLNEVDVYSDMAKGDFTNVNNWLREKIWKYGALKTPAELMEMAFEGKFDPSAYIEYLTNKYSELYGL